MAFINLLGEREALTGNSKEYKLKIISFMKKKGYSLIASSDEEGYLPDLRFARSYIEGKTETWVEAKYKEVGLWSKDFLSDLGKYYLSYISMNPESRFRFFIFIRKCKNISAWKTIFDPIKENIGEVKKLFMKVIASVEEELAKKIEKSGEDLFLVFIRDTNVYQVDYESLNLKINQIGRKKESLYQSPILEETSALKDESEVLIGNMLSVVGFPQWLWRTHGSNLNWKKELELQQCGCCVAESNKVYSISSPNVYRGIQESLGLDGWKKLYWNEWWQNEKTKINIVKKLIKQYIILKGRRIGCKYDRKTSSLFFVHENLANKIQKKSGRQLSRVYRTYQGKVYFVEHKSVRVNVRFLEGTFYIVLDPGRVFTQDGVNIIQGKKVKELHYKFPPKYEFNNVTLDWLKYWRKALGLGIKGLLDEENTFKISSKLLTVEINRKSERGIKFDEDVQLEYELIPLDQWGDL